MAEFLGWVPKAELVAETQRTALLRARVIAAETKERLLESEKRGLHDRISDLERQAAYLREATESWQGLYRRAVESKDNLVSTIVDMKREGFVPAPFADPGNLEKLSLDLPDKVMDAVAQRSQPGTELETRLFRWAMAAMREKGATEEAVAKRILDGGTPPVEE